MRKYRVVLMRQAQKELREKLAYIRYRLKNPQAAQSVLDDYRQTRKTLEEVAGTIREPDSARLKERGLRRINFKAHNYFILFRVRDDRAEITNIFYGSEDFEHKLK